MDLKAAFWIVILLPIYSLFAQSQQPTSTPTASPISHRSFQLPEISAAGLIGNRLVVAADDPEKKRGYHMIDCFQAALSRLIAGGSIGATPGEQIYRDILLLLQLPDAGEPDAGQIKDIEDMAVTSTGDVYLIASHSRKKNDEEVPERRQLLRVRFDRGSTKPASSAISSVPRIPRLPQELQEAATRPPGARDGQGNYTPGLNIEGLAGAPENDLLIGLRSPLIASKAVVLRMKKADATFDRPADPEATAPIMIEATLDLRGMGIRGMCYDEKAKGYWIIAGLRQDMRLSNPEFRFRPSDACSRAAAFTWIEILVDRAGHLLFCKPESADSDGSGRPALR